MRSNLSCYLDPTNSLRLKTHLHTAANQKSQNITSEEEWRPCFRCTRATLNIAFWPRTRWLCRGDMVLYGVMGVRRMPFHGSGFVRWGLCGVVSSVDFGATEALDTKWTTTNTYTLEALQGSCVSYKTLGVLMKPSGSL